MTILQYWQRCGAEPSVSSSLEEIIRESQGRFAHEERELFGVFEIDLARVREEILQRPYSRYDRNKLLKWLDSPLESVVKITDVQKYLRGFVIGVAVDIALKDKFDCLCRGCGVRVRHSEMKREPWHYHVNPQFAGTGYFLVCPQGHALVSVQETIS